MNWKPAIVPVFAVRKWPPLPTKLRESLVAGPMSERRNLIQQIQDAKWKYTKGLLARWIRSKAIRITDGSQRVEMTLQTKREIESQPALPILFEEIDADRNQVLFEPGPDDAAGGFQNWRWHFDAINLSVARRTELVGRGNGITVAILDSGVDMTHKELVSKPIRAVSVSATGRVTRQRSIGDGLGHGTYVAGLISGRTTGVAPASSLVCARVLSAKGKGTTASMLAGWNWALEQPDVRIIVVCLGFPYTAEGARQWQMVVSASLAHNVLPVMAAGNEGSRSLSLPGGTIGGLVVGASTRAGEVAEFSTSGVIRSRRGAIRVPDLVAPGDSIRSIIPGDQYKIWRGTTPATAIAGGMAALVWERNPDWTATQVRDAMLKSCRPLSVAPERQGCGLVQC